MRPEASSTRAAPGTATPMQRIATSTLRRRAMRTRNIVPMHPVRAPRFPVALRRRNRLRCGISRTMPPRMIARSAHCLQPVRRLPHPRMGRCHPRSAAPSFFRACSHHTCLASRSLAASRSSGERGVTSTVVCEGTRAVGAVRRCSLSHVRGSFEPDDQARLALRYALRRSPRVFLPDP